MKTVILAFFILKSHTHISPIDTLGKKMYSLIKVLAFISLLLF